MQINFISATLNRIKERQQILAKPRLAELGKTTSIPRLAPILWRALKTRWQAAFAKRPQT